MLTLAVDSSAVSASVALARDNKILSSQFVNAGLTHSETLLPMIKSILDECKVTVDEIELFSITNGPGSFTGIRIGVATIKGLAFKNNTNCVGISTLEAIACNFTGENCIVCAVMDARRNQFYNALFKVQDNKVERLCDDRAISYKELEEEIRKHQNVVVSGDGAKAFYDLVEDKSCLRIADDDKIFQNAKNFILKTTEKEVVKPNCLLPVYLRLSQAERELKLKKENK